MPSRQHRVKDLRINETMENLMPDLNYSPGAFSCYPASSLADYNIEQTALPSFTLDMSLYIVSTVISVKDSNVYFITIDKNSKGLYVDKNVRSRMDSSTSGLACLYSDGRQWKVSSTSDMDGGDVRVLSCHLPRYMHDCFITEYAESSMTIPLCVNVWLVRYKRATKKTIKREFRIIASLKGCVPAKRQHDQLAICAPPVTEEEWLILPEWLEYHLLVGFQHFYLYTTNGRRDQLSSKLKNYISQGIVSVRSWMSQPWTRLARNLQSLSARNDCLYRSKDRAKWLAFADVDEYFYPVNSDDVREIVESYHNKTKHDVIKMKKGYFRRPADTKVGKRLLIESYRRADLHRYSGRESFVIKPSNVSLINMQSDDITPATVNGHVSVNATTIRVNHYRSDYSNGSQLDSGMKRFIPRVKIHIRRRSDQCRQQ
ncbi:uncharacterized protein [Ptychodera flava]|uniref:uncharacterized protein n=1 Tax=Ptychodera flava TaxID=63121 RepID=UPI00396A2D4C